MISCLWKHLCHKSSWYLGCFYKKIRILAIVIIILPATCNAIGSYSMDSQSKDKKQIAYENTQMIDMQMAVKIKCIKNKRQYKNHTIADALPVRLLHWDFLAIKTVK